MIEKAQVSKSEVTGEAGISEIVEGIKVVEVEVRGVEILEEVNSTGSKLKTIEEIEVWRMSKVVEVVSTEEEQVGEITEVGESIERGEVVVLAREAEATIEAESK